METIEIPNDAKHSIFSASSASRWTSCFGSIDLINSMGNKDNSTSYSIKGTVLHHIASEVLTAKLQFSILDSLVGRQYKIKGNDEIITLDNDAIASVKMYLLEVRRIAVEERHTVGTSAQCLNSIEKRFEYTEGKFKGLGGTVDAIIYYRGSDHLNIVDYKSGYELVKVENNYQLMIYAMLAYDHLLAKGRQPIITRVTMTIVQPMNEDQPISSITLSLDGLMKKIRTVLNNTFLNFEQGNKQLVVGDHCRFCAAKPVCPKFYETTIEAAQNDFDLISNEDSKEMTLRTLSSSQIVKILHYADNIRQWLSSVETFARLQMEQGKSYEGFKLVEQRANRQWIDEEDAKDFLIRYLKNESLYNEPKFKSIPQVEKSLKEKYGKNSKAVIEKLQEFCHKPKKGLKITPDSDKRTAYQNSAQLDFKGV